MRLTISVPLLNKFLNDSKSNIFDKVKNKFNFKSKYQNRKPILNVKSDTVAMVYRREIHILAHDVN